MRKPLLKIAHGILIGGITAAVVLAAAHAGWIERLELITFDWRINWRLPAPSVNTSRIHIIGIDQYSLGHMEESYGVAWIWPRQIYEPILAFCARAGVRVLAFDMLYTERGQDVYDDGIFGDAIAAGPPVVMALPLSRTQGRVASWADAPVAASPYPLLEALPDDFGARLPHATRTDFPVTTIATNATLLGSVMATPDPDAKFRRLPLFTAFDGRAVPLLGAAAYAAVHGGSETLAQTGARTLNLDAQGRMTLRFRGPSQTHRFHNAAAIIESELRLREGLEPIIDPAELADGYIFLGATAPGLLDLKPTPVGPTYPGVELHATLLDNLLTVDGLRDTTPRFNALAILLLAILAGIGGRMSGKAWLSALLLTGLASLPFPIGLRAYAAGFWMPVAPLSIAAALAGTAALIVNYAVEGRQKRFIKGAFSQYLSPAVIEQLVRNPGQLTLGGEARELSILFSDVQGFTGISEGLSPTELTALLNTYLTAMTDIILEEGGTIDKYEGDAIIAFWNAPLTQPDHPLRAVRAALRCRQKLDAIRAELAARYGKELYARIGLNTGAVTVGNMGSNQRFDYTFLGDAGNLASRLEGINKVFGTYTIISETTREAIGDAYPVRELATVQVVGRRQAVRIFEPFLPEDDARQRETLDAFATGLQAWYQGDLETADRAFATIERDDPPAAAYRARIASLPRPLPSPRTGVWTATEKKPPGLS